MLNEATFEAALGAVYDAALDEGAHPEMLGRLATLFDCHFADTFRRAADYSEWHGTQFGLDERDYQDVFLGVWVKANVWGTRRPTRRAGDVVTTRDIAPVRDLKRSTMYSEYLHPRGLHEGLRLDIWAGDGWIEDISLLRRWQDGPYSTPELDAAHRLMPHLRRAAAVRRRLRRTEGMAAAGLEAFETVRTGILLLDGAGRVLHANGIAEGLLQDIDGLGVGPEGLVAATPAHTRQLLRLLHAAVARPGTPARSGSMRLPRASGQAALSVIALPLRSGAAGMGLQTPSVLVCVADPASGDPVAQEHLVGLFGLTPAEAALAGSLLTGLEVRDIAGQSGRSVATVRSLLGRLLAKTDTGRQSDLMRLLTKLPRQ